MAIIVTYDLPAKHIELKKMLFAKGYLDKVPHIQDGVQKYIHLPNTTVYHSGKTAKDGREDLQSCTIALNIKLERCISTQWGPDWAAIFGSPL